MEKITATLSVERELTDGLRVIEYGIGNGEVHFHSQIEICIVEDGEIDALVNNSQRILRRGDVAVSLSYDAHRYISRGEGRFSVIILPSDMCEKLYLALGTTRLSSPFVSSPERREGIIDYLSRLKASEGGSLARLGYVYLLLDLIEGELSAVGGGGSDDNELISRLLLYIHKNYDKDLTLSSIATEFGYHPSYISACFKSRLNIGISRYISIIRLKNAILLLHRKKHTVTEIALECGFASMRTFYRVFRSEFGCSPKEYLSEKK